MYRTRDTWVIGEDLKLEDQEKILWPRPERSPEAKTREEPGGQDQRGARRPRLEGSPEAKTREEPEAKNREEPRGQD